ncbi:CCHC-type domain-containing protein [Trichonephila clavipes]|nr:CCHC-type domain-containing protein [Trichonephila clavipes]
MFVEMDAYSSIDITNAYLYANLDTVIYMKQPTGYEIEIVYDMIIFGKEMENVNLVLQLLQKNFDLKIMGKTKKLLGIEFEEIARDTIDLLKDTFGDRLISRFGPVNWPPRSCDLTPLDYFLWGYVKPLVYADKPQTLDHLEDNIRRVIADIRSQMLKKFIENWTSRLDYIRASRGSPMPEIIFKMKNFDKGKVTEIKKFACFTRGSDKHFKRDGPKNKGVDNKRLNVNKVSTEGTELEDGTVADRVDLLDGKLVHALVDSGTEIAVIKKDLVPGISVEGASTIYLKSIFGPAVKCPLVYVPIGLAIGGQVNVVHQQVLCALEEVLVEDVLLPPDVLDMLGGAQSEENSLAQSSQDLRVDSGNVDETEGEKVTTEMDKGSMVADSFRSEQERCAELALAWKHAKEGKGNYYEVDGYLFHRDKILG